MSSIVQPHAPELGHDVHAHHPTGITRWLTTTNHKDIGTMYLWFSFTMFLVGGTMAMIIRAELFEPGLQIVNPDRHIVVITRQKDRAQQLNLRRRVVAVHGNDGQHAVRHASAHCAAR